MTICTRAQLFGETDHVGGVFKANVIATALELLRNWATSGTIETATWQRANLIVVLSNSEKLKSTGRKSLADSWDTSLKGGLRAVQVWLQNLKFSKKNDHEEWVRHMATLRDTFEGDGDTLYSKLETAVRNLIPRWTADAALITGVCGDGRLWKERFEFEDTRRMDPSKCKIPVVDKEDKVLDKKSDAVLLIAGITMLTAMRKALVHDVTGDVLFKVVEYEVKPGIFLAANHHPLTDPGACHGAFIMDKTSTKANECVLHALVTLSQRVELDWTTVASTIAERFDKR